MIPTFQLGQNISQTTCIFEILKKNKNNHNINVDMKIALNVTKIYYDTMNGINSVRKLYSLYFFKSLLLECLTDLPIKFYEDVVHFIYTIKLCL